MDREVDEECLSFPCAGDRLFGILAAPPEAAAVGVLVLVGGPQYRVGSHRQFTLLGRGLAAAGYPTLRFDFRGMGDSEGEQRDFENVGADIAAALDAYFERCPRMRRVVLWGLCDAASAALLYWGATRDRRVAGLCLLNPWVRSEVTQARTQIKHYYARRFLDRAFWRKLLGGQVKIAAALREALGKAWLARRGRPAPAAAKLRYQDAMALAWREFTGPLLVILSGRDDTAREFEILAAGDEAWRGLLRQPKVRRVDVPEANHTFSSSRWRAEVTAAVIGWLRDSGDELDTPPGPGAAAS